MIGRAGRQDILLGYNAIPITEVEKQIFTPWNKADLANQISGLQDKIKTGITELRANAKAQKQALEEEKKKKMNSGDEDVRHDWLFKTYVPRLREIGVTTGTAQTKIKTLQEYKNFVQAVNNGCSAPKQDKDSGKFVILKVNIGNEGLSIRKLVGQEKVGETFIFKFVTKSEEAFETFAPTSVAVPALARVIYFKKWSGDQGQQYVTDDDGVFTRRYGYAAKGFDVLDILLSAGFLEGKYAAGAGPAADAGKAIEWDDKILKLTPEEKGKYQIAAKDDKLSVRQMLFVHQELGSGDSQRGICLTSTPTYDIPSNQGVFFTSGDIFRIKVDLARVPIGKQLLYNLYRPEAQEKAQAVAMTKFDRKANDYITYSADPTHMLDSVSKNREIFLRVLVPDYIVNLAEMKLALTNWKAKKEAERLEAERKRLEAERLETEKRMAAAASRSYGKPPSKGGSRGGNPKPGYKPRGTGGGKTYYKKKEDDKY